MKLDQNLPPLRLFWSKVTQEDKSFLLYKFLLISTWMFLVIATRVWHEPYRDETEVIYFLSGKPSVVEMINDQLINGGFSWNLIVWFLSGGGSWSIYKITVTCLILAAGSTYFLFARANLPLKIFLLFNPFYFFDWLVITRVYTLIWVLSMIGMTIITRSEKKNWHRNGLLLAISMLISLSVWGILCSAALVIGHANLKTFRFWIFSKRLLVAKLISILWITPHLLSLIFVYGSNYQGGIVSEFQGNRVSLTDFPSKLAEFTNRLSIYTFGQIREDYNLWNKKQFTWYLSEAASSWYLLLLVFVLACQIYMAFGLKSLLSFSLVFCAWAAFNVLVYMGFERHFYYFAFAPFLVLGQRVRKKVKLKLSATTIGADRKLKNTVNVQIIDSSREFDDLRKNLVRVSHLVVAILMISPVSYSLTILKNDKNYLFSAAAAYGKKLGKQRSYVILNSSLYPSLLLDNQLSILSLFGPELDRKQTISKGLALGAFDRNLVYGGKVQPERLGKFCSYPNPTLITTLTTYKVISGLPNTTLPLIDKSPPAMVTDEGDLRIIDLNEMCKQDSSLKSLWPHAG